MTIVHVTLQNPPSQLAFAKSTRVTVSVLHERTLKVKAIVCVYLQSPPSQLKLVARDNVKVKSIVHVHLPSSPSQLAWFARYHS